MGSFFASIGGWFARNPLALVLICMAIFVTMLIVSKDATIAEVRANSAAKDTAITRLTKDNATLANNNTVLSASLQKQNTALESLVTKATQQDSRFDAVMAGLAASQKALSGKITAIDNAQPGADKCASAFELMKGAAR